jgi:hypothetical protein
MLGFIKDIIWKSMFGKPADLLERATDHEDECKKHSIPSALTSFFKLKGCVLRIGRRYDQRERVYSQHLHQLNKGSREPQLRCFCGWCRARYT